LKSKQIRGGGSDRLLARPLTNSHISEIPAVAVRIRMKKLGRTHRPFFRICAMDSRAPRDGRVIEELGYYDPMVKETDARAILRGERIDYWLGVGAKPSVNVRTLIKKYGTNGTHLEQQQQALGRLKIRPEAPPAVAIPLPKKEEPAAEVPESAAATATEEAAEAPAEEKAAEAPAAEAATEQPAAEAPAEDAAPAEESPADENKEESAE
jgi:small subunit ribosomal protein S16